MPHFYRFLRADNREPVPLSRVDDLVREAFGAPRGDTGGAPRGDTESYSMEFQIISSVGDVAWAPGSWDESAFERICEKINLSEAFVEIARRFLNGEYVYDCWSQR